MSSRLKQLGLDQKTVKTKVKVMNKEDFTKSIEALNEMPLDQYNKLILHKPNTVIEKTVEIIEVTKCKEEDCEIIQVEFKLLFNYIIGGYNVNRYFYTLEDTNKNRNNDLIMRDTTLKRTGGIFYMKVSYYHHTTFCGKSFISSVIQRTPHSLMIPNYDLLVERGYTPDQMKVLIEKVKETQDKWKVNLADLEDVVGEFKIEGCEEDHREDFCVLGDCEEVDYCDYSHYEDSAEYCKENCDKGAETNELALFLTHPHFFNEMSNFCTGNQFSSNRVLLELQKYPNPITYIAEMIRICNDVNFQDSYYSDRFMVDVFEKWGAFNSYDRSLHRLRDVVNYHNISTTQGLMPSEYHSLSANCLCMDCLTFRVYLANGLKFDPTKLILADIGEVDIKVLKKHLREYYKNDSISNSDRDYIIDIAEIDIMDSKYHFEDKSLYDQKLMGTAHNSFYLGLFKNKRTEELECVYTVNIKDNYLKYNSFGEIRDTIQMMNSKIFSKEQYEKFQEILPYIQKGMEVLQDKTITEYLDLIYEQVSF